LQAANEIRSQGWNVVESKGGCRKNEGQEVEDKLQTSAVVVALRLLPPPAVRVRVALQKQKVAWQKGKRQFKARD
jgi:hypothetical protein